MFVGLPPPPLSQTIDASPEEAVTLPSHASLPLQCTPTPFGAVAWTEPFWQALEPKHVTEHVLAAWQSTPA